MLTTLVPTVFYADVSVGLDLFVDGLGLAVVHRDDPLVVVARDSVKLCLVEDAELAAGERPELDVETDDLDAVFADLSSRRPDLLHPNLDRPTLREWGAREVALLDETTVCVVLRAWPGQGVTVSGR